MSWLLLPLQKGWWHFWMTRLCIGNSKSHFYIPKGKNVCQLLGSDDFRHTISNTQIHTCDGNFSFWVALKWHIFNDCVMNAIIGCIMSLQLLQPKGNFLPVIKQWWQFFILPFLKVVFVQLLLLSNLSESTFFLAENLKIVTNMTWSQLFHPLWRKNRSSFDPRKTHKKTSTFSPQKLKIDLKLSRCCSTKVKEFTSWKLP